MSFEKLVALATDGRFTLPAELLTAEAERARLVKAVSDLRRSLPDWDGSAQANLNADAIRAADNAADRADNRVRNFMRANGDRIVTESLRPAFDALLNEARELPRDTPTTADEAVTATQRHRDAYIKLVGLVPVYKAIMAAAEIIYGTAGRDNWRLFADTQAEPRGDVGQVRGYVNAAGPDETAARLRWLAHSSDAWLPTARERDARHLAWCTVPMVDFRHSAAVNNTY
jgi:hypothetical protein